MNKFAAQVKLNYFLKERKIRREKYRWYQEQADIIKSELDSLRIDIIEMREVLNG